MTLSFEIEDSVRERLAAHARADVERAGLLMARLLDGVVIVVDLTEPGPACSGTRTSCHMDGAHHTAEARRLWDASGGGVFALGHWHTHPEPDPLPSDVDLDDWERRLRDDWGGASHVVFAIAGTERVRAWVGDVASGRFQHDGRAR